MKKVKVSAPGKLMLFGEHAVIYGRPCIVTAVDQRIIVSVKIQKEKKLSISAPEVGIKDYSVLFDKIGKSVKTPKGVRFVEASVKNFFKEYTYSYPGLQIETKSDFSSEFGFGSSSAVTVGVIKALSMLFGKRMGNRELFLLSYKTVLDIQGVGSGFDLAAAIWGGTLYFVTGGKKILPLKVGKLPLVVGYTGIKADTPTLVKQVASLHKKERKIVEAIFDTMTSLTEEARASLKKRNFVRVGQLMDINQGLLDSLGVSSPELANLIFAARSKGAYGAKLSGAGGGDCMISLVSEKKRKEVRLAIKKIKGKVISVKPGAEGVRLEK